MQENITSLSPLDGRYHGKLDPLRSYFSEFGLIRFRVAVEVQWFITLSMQADFTALPSLTASESSFLSGLVLRFDHTEAAKVKQIEATTRHDVKAVEYYLKAQFATHPTFSRRQEWLHFGCTSEDINNVAYALIMKQALIGELIPIYTALTETLKEQAHTLAAVPMLSRTHGQSATPTTLGKEFANVAHRLGQQLTRLQALPVYAKFNGAVGNYNAVVIAYPDLGWEEITTTFIESLGLTFNPYTTQIEPHDGLCDILSCVEHLNTICLDFAKDMWGYISLGYFRLKNQSGEIGSSTMPHKINPIDFENAEGNLGIANALLSHFIQKLPISRWQRDLSDSTVLRNLGVALGHGYLAVTALQQGLSRCEPDRQTLAADLEAHWVILGEAIQTVLRAEGIEQAYETLKDLTRGQAVDKNQLHAFIQSLPISPAAQQRLLALSPHTYTGLAEKLAKLI